MTTRTRVILDLLALTLAFGMARESGAESSAPESDAVRAYAQRYYLAYQEKYGLLLRIQQMLQACDLEPLATQVEADLPKVSTFAAEQFGTERVPSAPQRPTPEMTAAVMRATQQLSDESELAYADAFRRAAKTNSACTGVEKVYDTYLKSKQK
jgi:hypothetical protein